MIVEQQANKQIVVNEISIMRDMHHQVLTSRCDEHHSHILQNIVNFLECYLDSGVLWVKFMIKK